jgi:hypothetical protein
MGTNITRISLITTLILMVSLLSVSIALTKGPTVHAGKSNIGHLYLEQKNPETWEIVKAGAWGKMTYRLSSRVFRFIFDGNDAKGDCLKKEQDYALAYYPDQWPGKGLIYLGSGTAYYNPIDGGISVHIKNKADTESELSAY